MNVYDVGDKVKITGTFKEEGELGDPAVIRGLYKSPYGTVTTLTYPDDIIKVSMGLYSFEINTDVDGLWHYRMDDGLINVAAEGTFQVKRSNVI